MTKGTDPTSGTSLPGHRAPGTALGPSLVGGLVLVLVVIGVTRLIAFGWATVAPDDARYLYTGLSTLAGDGPVTSNGNLLLLRSPAYGLVLATGGQPFDDPLTGARIVAAIIGIAGFVGAVRLAWIVGGPAAAAGTAISVIAMPLVWRLLPTLRIDLPQTAGVIAVLLAIQKPTPRRWLVAGALLGITILVKETILLLAGLPIAALGLVPFRRLALLTVAYLGAAVAVAGWWWALVWIKAGVIFPTNAIGAIEARQVGSDIRIDLYGAILIVVAAVAWAILGWRARRALPERIILVAAAAMLLPAIYATLNGLSSRNYVGLAVLSTVAMGVAAATLGHWLTSRTAGRRFSARFVWAAIGIVLISGAIAGQRAAGRPSESSLPGQIHDWLRPRLHAGSQVVMSFRYSDVTALTLFELAAVPELPITRYQPAQGLGPYLWLGLRDQQLFGFRRTAWVAMLGDARTSHLVLAGPHVFTPAELFPALEAGLLDGVTIAKRLVDGRESARIYTVDPGLAITEPTLALHLAPAAALVWLETARSSQAGVSVEQMLVDAGPVLVGDDARLVLERLAGSACLVPSGEGRGARKNDTPDSFRLVPATVDAASQPGSICTAEA